MKTVVGNLLLGGIIVAFMLSLLRGCVEVIDYCTGSDLVPEDVKVLGK